MLSLLEGEFVCCGTLCDKVKAQQQIDRLQRAVDMSFDLLQRENWSDESLQFLFTELKELATKENR